MHVFFNYPRAHVLAETEEGWKDPIMGYGHVVITSLPFLQAARSWGAHTQASCVFKPLEPVSEPLLGRVDLASLTTTLLDQSFHPVYICSNFTLHFFLLTQLPPPGNTASVPLVNFYSASFTLLTLIYSLLVSNKKLP